MQNSIAAGRRVAARTVLAQAGAAVLVAALFLLLQGKLAGLSALVGGLTIAGGNALFAWRLFGAGLVAPQRVVSLSFSAEALKWLGIGIMFYLAIAVWKLPFLPLIAGVLAAQFTFWIALIAIR